MQGRTSTLSNAQWKKNKLVTFLGINRLKQAHKSGFFEDISPRILVLGCPKPEALTNFGFIDLVICHPEKSIIRKAQELGFQTISEGEKFNKVKVLRSIGATLVWVTKSRRETFFNMAIALIATKKNGKIIITGEKKDGVEGALKKIKTIIDPVNIISKSHGKIALFQRPQYLPKEIQVWKKMGKLQKTTSGYFSVAGAFSETEIDTGSLLLADQFSGKLFGSVADLGSGWGYLSSEAIKNSPNIEFVTLIDSHFGALESARRNITSSKAQFLWADLQSETLNINNFDHVIMNPPFHIGRKVELGLGLAFLSIAKNILTKGGTLWMVYNQELPYEKTMNSLFTNYQFLNKTKTYNVIRAKKT